MPRVQWTPEETARLLDLIASGKSWTLISGMLKRSMKSVKLHAETLQRNSAKKNEQLKVKK
jgi:DNA-binding NarL/FixJ family response regulator